MGLTILIVLFLFCFNFLVRKVPWNYGILFLFTFSNSYTVAGISIFQDPENVLIAGAITFGMFFGLSVLAFFVKLCNLLV